jgi:proline dehydrogenase
MTDGADGDRQLGAYLDGARALRRMALDEGLKARIMRDPALAEIARRVASRYVAGETLGDAMRRASSIADRGHAVSLELVGESVRDRDEADQATDVFVEVAEAIGRSGLPATVSLDLSHIGLLIDPRLGVCNAKRIAAAAAAAETIVMVSAEGSDRTDLVLDAYEEVLDACPAVGITLQARLRRTPDDLERVMARPGTVRLVKGAFEEPEEVALAREDAALQHQYLSLAGRLIASGHKTSIATHDQRLLDELVDQHGPNLREGHVEFEMLLGLGEDILDEMQAGGYRTREYVVFGHEWWLYVLNRMSEQPDRLHRAVDDALVPVR